MVSPTINMRANITGLLQTSDDQPYVDINELKSTVDTIWPTIPIVYGASGLDTLVGSLSAQEATTEFKGKLVCVDAGSSFTIYLIVGAVAVGPVGFEQTELKLIPLHRQPKDNTVYGGWDVQTPNVPNDTVADYSTKTYVDTAVSTANGTLFNLVVPRSGTTMTGLLTLSGNPTSNLHAATKQYVDTSRVIFLTRAEINALPSGLTVQQAIDAHKGKIVFATDTSTAYIVFGALDVSGSTQLQLVPITRQAIDATQTPLA
jgi:hypothetical protein